MDRIDNLYPRLWGCMDTIPPFITNGHNRQIQFVDRTEEVRGAIRIELKGGCKVSFRSTGMLQLKFNQRIYWKEGN